MVAVYALPAGEDGHTAPHQVGAAARGAQNQAGIARYAAILDLAVEVRAVFRDHPVLEIFHSGPDISVRDLHLVSEAVAQKPYIVDAGGRSRATNVRLFWTSFMVTASPTREVTFTETEHATVVDFTSGFERDEAWVDQGSGFGRGDGVRLPALVRAEHHVREPSDAPGIADASPGARSRWAADHFRIPVYHYEEEVLVSRGARASRSSSRRSPSARSCTGSTRGTWPQA